MDQHPGHSTLGDGLDWEAVGRYLAGECTADEAAAVRRILDRSPADAAFVAMLQRAVLPASSEPVEVEGALVRVHARLDESAALPLVPGRKASWWMGSRSVAPGLALAAALTLMIGGALVWRAVRAPAEALVAEGASQRITTGVGQSDTVHLADGSTVVLGPASVLDADIGVSGERRVTLSGEAYFIVRHDDARPFVVRAGAMIIRDVGTEFTVRNARETPVRVAVTEGVVAVRTMDDVNEMTLRAGDVAVAGVDGRIISQRQAVAEADTAWKGGQLVFADAVMSDVRDGLRRWYGVEIRYDSALAGRHVTATFRGEPVQRVLDVIALTLGARVERRGDTASMSLGPVRQ